MKKFIKRKIKNIEFNDVEDDVELTNTLKSKPTIDWSAKEVKTFLHLNGLSKYKSVFEKEKIDGETLLDLNLNDLLQMNIPQSPRNQLIAEIHSLNKRTSKFSYNAREYITLQIKYYKATSCSSSSMPNIHKSRSNSSFASSPSSSPTSESLASPRGRMKKLSVDNLIQESDDVITLLRLNRKSISFQIIFDELKEKITSFEFTSIVFYFIDENNDIVKIVNNEQLMILFNIYPKHSCLTLIMTCY